MPRRELAHPTLPSAPGFSRALEVSGGRTIWLSGQVPTPVGGGDVPTGLAEQADICLGKIADYLDAAGGSMADVVKVTFFTTDMAGFGAVRPVRDRYFKGPLYPAMTGVEVTALADPSWLIEIDAVAVVE